MDLLESLVYSYTFFVDLLESFVYSYTFFVDLLESFLYSCFVATTAKTSS